MCVRWPWFRGIELGSYGLSHGSFAYANIVGVRAFDSGVVLCWCARVVGGRVVGGRSFYFGECAASPLLISGYFDGVLWALGV